MSAAAGRAAQDTRGPLTLTRAIDGPWLAIPLGAAAEIASLVLVSHPHAPGMWRSIDGDHPRVAGAIRGAGLTALADFNVGVSLYSHARVMSVYVAPARPTRARYLDIRGYPLPRLGYRRWEGKRCDRIRVARELWDHVAAAVDALREAQQLMEGARDA